MNALLWFIAGLFAGGWTVAAGMFAASWLLLRGYESE